MTTVGHDDSYRPLGIQSYPEEVQRLLKKAHEAMHEHRMDEGERLLYEVLEYAPIPTVINNLAVMQLEVRDQPEEALRLLSHNLEQPQELWQPFTRALAAQSHIRLNEPGKARRLLQQAIRDFELGLASLPETDGERRWAWQEYTSKIMRAVGELGEDRWAWELYRRWSKYHVRDSSHFYGAVAAFNLKRFRAARFAWRRVREGLPGFLRACETVALWCEQGFVEPFLMEYDNRGPDTKELLSLAVDGSGPTIYLATDEANRRLGQFLQRPSNRLFMLWSTFRPFIPSEYPGQPDAAALAGVTFFTAAAGDWGEAFAQRLLASEGIDTPVKIALAEGLVEAGRLDPKETVSLGLDEGDRDPFASTAPFS